MHVQVRLHSKKWGVAQAVSGMDALDNLYVRPICYCPNVRCIGDDHLSW